MDKDEELFKRMHSYEVLKDFMQERAKLLVGIKHLAATRRASHGKTSTKRFSKA